MTTRRAVLASMGAAAIALPVRAVSEPEERLLLWHGNPPDAPAILPSPRTEYKSRDPLIRWRSGIDRPWLSVRRPAQANGAAAIVIPGGGYGFLSWDREGEAPARWLARRGITAFILAHRLPGEGWASRATTALSDAQRAIRLIRTNAERYAIDPSRIAVLGFSAGGHVAASLAARYAEPTYAPVDAADAHIARPDLIGLLYPVVSMHAPFAHIGSRDALLGSGAPDEHARAASVELQIKPDIPPIFLAHAADDTVVPWMHSLVLFEAMRAADRPAVLHVFENGGHGFGLHLPAPHLAGEWPLLFHRFAASHGIFPRCSVPASGGSGRR